MFSKISSAFPITKKIAVLCAFLFIAILFLEFYLRFFAPQNISPVIAELDPILGYKLKANVTAVHKTTEFNTIVHTNSEGYRSSEMIYEKGDKTRILFLGDSMTYGWGVNTEERFSDIVAKNLDLEMLNTGVPGYKVSNMDAYYETEGYKYHSDIVLLAYNLRTGIVNINSQEYEVNNSTLIKKTLYVSNAKNNLKNIVAEIPFYSFLSQHSQLFSFFRNIVVGLLEQQQVGETLSNCTTLQDQWYSHNKEREVLIVQDIQNFTTQQNSSFILVLLPLPSCNFTNLLSDFKNATNVTTVIDLSSTFANNTSSYYYPIDQHWNAQGHALAAQTIITALNLTLQ